MRGKIMDDIWNKLFAIKVSIDTEKSRRNTDKKFSSDLKAGLTDGDLSKFYLAVQSVELGCGFQKTPEFIEMCVEASVQDNLKLLQVLEQKTHMIDVLMILLCIDKSTKLLWIQNNLVSKPAILFECIRQILKHENSSLSTQDTKIIAGGLAQLPVLSPYYFRSIIQYNQFEKPFAPILTALWEVLSASGWEEYGKVISFSDYHSDDIQYIDGCIKKLNNTDILEHLLNKAFPVVEAWLTFLEHQRQKQKFGLSLYNNYSNLLIRIMTYHLKEYTDFFKLLERTICRCETDSYRWYESETQQHDVLYTHLSLAAHLRFVWENNKLIYGIEFPEIQRSKLIKILKTYCHFWDNRRDNQSDEIKQLLDWLNFFERKN